MAPKHPPAQPKWFGHYPWVRCYAKDCREKYGGPLCPQCWNHSFTTREQRNIIKQQFNEDVLSNKIYDPSVSRFCIIQFCWNAVPKIPQADEDGRCTKCYNEDKMPSVPPALPVPPPPTPVMVPPPPAVPAVLHPAGPHEEDHVLGGSQGSRLAAECGVV